MTTILNSSIVTNTGNAIFHGSGGALYITNTIVAGSTGSNCSGNPLTTFGSSLSSDTTCSGTATAYIGLGSLASNGGNTQTIALAADSPAIDAGDATTCANSPVSGFDQRGQARNDLQCDIGAYEMKIADRNQVKLQPSSSKLTTYGPAGVGIQYTGTDPGVITATKVTNWTGGTPAGALGAWWEITPVTNTGLNLTLKLCYSDAENGNLVEDPTRRFWKYNGTWNDMGAANVSGSSPNKCGQITGVADLSRWTIANTGWTQKNPTAVTLSSFQAQSPAFDLGQWFRQLLGLER